MGKSRKRKLSGSLTLETSLVLPIFMCLAISLVSFLEMMNLYAKVEYALHETAREIALFTYPVEAVSELSGDFLKKYSDSETDEENIIDEMEDADLHLTDAILDETLVRAAFTERFGYENLNNTLIRKGEAGILFFRSTLYDEAGNINLIVTYEVEPLLNIFGVGETTFCNSVKMHPWTGYSKGFTISDEQYVYITENSSVYHTNPHCSHLHISVDTVNKSEIEQCRNKDGKKYHACEKCCGNGKSDECFFLFITPYGDRYHTSLSCSGLKRTVFKVKLSEVSDKKECERCASYREGGSYKEDEYD